jgi:dolichol-phosphate mannosyltransferase
MSRQSGFITLNNDQMFIKSQTSLIPVPTGALIVPNRRSQMQTEDTGSSLNEHSWSGLVNLVKFSLIVPTYNEGGNVEKIVRSLSLILDEALPENYELIIVDDNSPDGTWERAQSLIGEYPQLRVMRREHERGLSTAVIRGWQVARGEVLGVIDGDLQHPPEALLQLLAAIENGSDMVVASRHVDGGGVSTWSATRRFLSRGAQLLGLVILPRVVSRVSDPMSGYFMLRRSAIAEQPMSPLGYKILIEVLGRGVIDDIAEVGYVFQEREEGESKVTWKQYIDYFQHLVRLRVDSGRLGKLRRRLEFPLDRFSRFALVGLSGVVVDVAVLYFLYSVLGLGLIVSAVAAAEIAIINNFIWNDRWTFGDLANRQRAKRMTIKRFLKFNIICLMGLVLKVPLLLLFLYGLHIPVYAANFMAIAIVTFWNFWINLNLKWRVTQVK